MAEETKTAAPVDAGAAAGQIKNDKKNHSAGIPNGAMITVPRALRAHKAWLLWKFEGQPGNAKPRKVPYYIDGQRRKGDQGSPADRAALTTYDQVMKVFLAGGYDGIGFATLPDWRVVALDFDDVITDGVIRQDVAALISCTYSEVSPSGRGVPAQEIDTSIALMMAGQAGGAL